MLRVRKVKARTKRCTTSIRWVPGAAVSGAVDLGAFRHRLVDGARQLLALPRPPAKEQGSEDRHGELLTRDVIGVPHLAKQGLGEEPQ
jgi:hypothetical protein